MTTTARRAAILLATFALLAGPLASTAVAAEPPRIAPPGNGLGADPDDPTSESPDEILIRYRPGTTAAQRAAVDVAHGLTRLNVADGSGGGRTELAVAEGRSPAAVRRQLAQDPRVAAVAPNYHRELAIDVSTEPYFEDEWGLDNAGQTLSGTVTQTGVKGVDIDGLQAVRGGIGKSSTVVAVIDDGIDFGHPDLTARAWTNPGEAGAKSNNGIDDDDNGYIDDVHGWDFCNDDNTVHDAGQDGHGTHVAGTIAASQNGSGIVGVAPGVTLMALKFIDDSNGCGSDQMAILAIDYAASFGVHIINASWGGPEPSAVLDSAIGDSDALFVAAAGNNGTNIDAAGATRFYPAASTQPNVISVAAIDQTGHLASFSNYGNRSVDLAAPGTNIISTYVAIDTCSFACYAWAAGTSMAAPHVTGTAALVGSYADWLLRDPIRMKARLLATAKTLAPTAGKTLTGKLVNAFRAVDLTKPYVAAPDRFTVKTGTIIGATSVKTAVAWPTATDTGTGVAAYELKRHAASGWSVVTASTSAREAATTLTYEAAYAFQLKAKDLGNNVGGPASTPTIRMSLYQSGSSLAKYGSGWSSVSSSGASTGHVNTAGKAGATMTFTFTGRSVAIVSPKSAGRGSMKVYVDGAYVSTVSLYRSSTINRSVVFSKGWTTSGAHQVRVIVVGSSGHPRVDLDAFVVAR